MKTIVIDSGHGGQVAAGTSSPNAVTGRNGMLEKTLTLDVARRMRAELDGQYRVLLTRDRDTNLTLGSRAALSQREGADLFLALHFNGHGDPGVQGSETFVHARAGNPSRMLASRIQRAVVDATGHPDRGVAAGELAVLSPQHHASGTAACLTEISYLSDPREEDRLRQPGYRQHIAGALAGAVREYLGGGGYGRVARAYTTDTAHAGPPSILSFTCATHPATVGATLTLHWQIVGNFSKVEVWPAMQPLPVTAEGSTQVVATADDVMPGGAAALFILIVTPAEGGEPVYQELSVPLSGGPSDHHDSLALLGATPSHDDGHHGHHPQTTMAAGLSTPGANVVALWRDLINHRPPTSIQAAIKARDASWFFHRLEGHPSEISHGAGDINLDFYPVRVTVMPMDDHGKRYTPDEWLEVLRRNINTFIDTSYSSFHPYSSRYSTGTQDDHWLTKPPGPLGAVLSIDIPAVQVLGVTVIRDDGSVCCTRSRNDTWTFSTVHTTRDGDHPVSGNRQFGYIQMDDGSVVFYTKGADRATGIMNNAPIANYAVFAGGHSLWLSFQARMKAKIDAAGGAATVGVPFSKRVWWTYVRHLTFNPTTPWT